MVQQAANSSSANPFGYIMRGSPGPRSERRDHVQLPELFLDRHRVHQCIVASHLSPCRVLRGDGFNPLFLLDHEIATSGTV
jgi:hypothetical protein